MFEHYCKYYFGWRTHRDQLMSDLCDTVSWHVITHTGSTQFPQFLLMRLEFTKMFSLLSRSGKSWSQSRWCWRSQKRPRNSVSKGSLAKRLVTVIITLIPSVSLLYIILLQVLFWGPFLKNPFNLEDIVAHFCELDLPSHCIIDEWKVCKLESSWEHILKYLYSSNISLTFD